VLLPGSPAIGEDNRAGESVRVCAAALGHWTAFLNCDLLENNLHPFAHGGTLIVVLRTTAAFKAW